MFQRKKLSLAIASAVGIGAIGVNAPVLAQDAEEVALEEVVVTGSRIRRADLTAVTPVSVTTGEEFKISGNLNIEQKMAELPQTLPSFGPSSNNPGNGTATVNLRGLGTARTLVLVNGRRYIPSTQTGVVDLNTIPGTLIKQVDITTGGASAVYGSDALSGVVNFQLVDDFEGVEVTTLYDTTTEGDGEKINIDLTMGGNFDDGRGNAVLYTGYARRDPVFQGDRDFSKVALREGDGELVPGGSSGIPGTRVVGAGVLPNGERLGTFNPDGTGRAFRDSDRFNYAPDNFLQLPQERYVAMAMAHYDITENSKLYGELTFTRNQVDTELAPTPAFLRGATPAVVNPDSPFFGPGAQAALNGIRSDTNGDGVINGDDNAVIGFTGRRMVENGPRRALNTRNASRLLVGFQGDLNDNWGYDAYYSRSTLDRIQLQQNDVSKSRFLQAILVNDSGTACQDPSNGCVPMNIFGAGNISQAAIDFVNVGATNVTEITQEVYQANVSGSLGTIGSASNPVGVVLGVEYRKDASEFTPDTNLSTGNVLGFNAGDATVGSYDSTEVFAEVSAPVTDQVELWGAFRHSDYSNIGGVNSFATAINFAASEKASFRVGYQQAVRAPNVFELFQGSSNGFPGATDPCSVAGFKAGVTDVALCQATGVPAGQVGVFTQPNAQIQGSFGGNADLNEETSDTFTIGTVLQPTDNLDITLDYYNIEIEDAISVLGGGVANVLDICYNQIKDASSPFCSAVERDGSGFVNIVRVLNENIGKIETSGVDLALNYTSDLDFGIGDNGSTLDLNVKATYLTKFDVTPVADLDTVNECAGSYGSTCGAPRNELIVNTRATLVTGAWTFSTLLRYLSAADDDRIATADADPSSLIVPEIKAEFYLDLAASYAFNDDLTVNFGVNNILDTKPTALDDVQASQANTWPETYSLLGPRAFISASYRFR